VEFWGRIIGSVVVEITLARHGAAASRAHPRSRGKDISAREFKKVRVKYFTGEEMRWEEMKRRHA
jgi:hypothetical protein